MIDLLRTAACFVLGIPVVLACLSAGGVSGAIAAAQESHPAGDALSHPAHTARAESHTVPALFVSDVHFDPFHDPGKVKQLAAAPVSQWESILASPPSADQQQALSALERSCRTIGIDTPFALLQSSLKAMHAQEPDAKFMMVSGDLIAHEFPCRYATLFPDAPHADYEAFVVKTVKFVAQRFHDRFPGMPIYMALGNNDSGCGDYQLDAGNDWLAQTGKVVAEDLPASEQQQAAKEFAAGGYYAVTMAEPMKNTRLVVVNDVFFSPKYRTCSGQSDPTAADEQLSWLEQQFEQARQAGARVWVLGHIPPGIDLPTSARKLWHVCRGGSLATFLASDKMADLLVENADIVRLATFGHTHMDELRLLKSEQGDGKSAEGHAVVVKQIPSISPVDGNNPSFTTARVDPTAATIEDYTVFAASNQTGIGTNWAKEYEYRATYHEPDFSASTMMDLAKKLEADQAATLPISQSYLRNYFVGNRAAELSPFWTLYTCTLEHYTVQGYTSCECSERNDVGKQ